MVPVNGRHGGHGQNGLLAGDVPVEIPAGGDGVADEHQAVKSHGVTALLAAAASDAGRHSGADAPVAFAHQILGAQPAFIACQPVGDEGQQRLGIIFNGEELIRTAVVQQQAVAGGHRVHHHDVRHIQQAVDVVHGLIGRQRGGLVRIRKVFHALGAQETHMDHHRRGSGAAVEAEQHRPVSGVLDVRPEIGIGKDGSDGLSLFIVENIILADSPVRDGAAAQRHRSFRGKAGGFKIGKVLCFIKSLRHIGRSFVWFRFRVLPGKLSRSAPGSEGRPHSGPG